MARPEFDVVIDSIVASVDYLSRNVRYSAPDNLALITGYGDSMQPTFSDGDILLVDTGITEIKIDAVYVMALKDELYIKRMQRRGRWHLSDDLRQQRIPTNRGIQRRD
ncbi:S24 family peptidase [Pseudomonas aeruginosa]